MKPSEYQVALAEAATNLSLSRRNVLDRDGILILRPTEKPVQRVEIARSFSYKLNCANYGGAQYESRDFFCSEKAECSIEDAPEVSAALYQFCRSEVLKAVGEYVREMKRQRENAA